MAQYDIILKADDDFINRVKSEVTKHGCSISTLGDGTVSINVKNIVDQPLPQFIEKFLNKCGVNVNIPNDLIINNYVMKNIFDNPYDALKKVIRGEELDRNDETDLFNISDRLDHAYTFQQYDFEEEFEKLIKDTNNKYTVSEMIPLFEKNYKINRKNDDISEKDIMDTWKHIVLTISLVTNALVTLNKYTLLFPPKAMIIDMITIVTSLKNFDKLSFNDFISRVSTIKETFNTIKKTFKETWSSLHDFVKDDIFRWDIFFGNAYKFISESSRLITNPAYMNSRGFGDIKMYMTKLDKEAKELEKFVPYMILAKRHGKMPDINAII